MTVTADPDAGKTVARALLSAGCVTLKADEPFRLPSGWTSPIYMDCRRLISFPAIRRNIVSLGIDLLRARHCLDGLGSIAGGETSGIALAAWFAEALDLPLQYVRKKPIGRSQIEGVIKAGEPVLLVDDVMAGGRSAAKFCRALVAAGAIVKDVFVIFDYGTFPTSDVLGALELRVHSLATWADVVAVAREDGTFNAQALGEIEAFLRDPPGWSEAHGGIASTAGVN
jgi:orotate phosphoribosyltransferase